VQSRVAAFPERLGAGAPTAKGFKQEGFAEACDLHRTHVSLLERDRIDITVSTARQIAHGLKVSVSE
jgi:transcriptional regulator with XRE-family HTH domain